MVILISLHFWIFEAFSPPPFYLLCCCQIYCIQLFWFRREYLCQGNLVIPCPYQKIWIGFVSFLNLTQTCFPLGSLLVLAMSLCLRTFPCRPHHCVHELLCYRAPFPYRSCLICFFAILGMLIMNVAIKSCVFNPGLEPNWWHHFNMVWFVVVIQNLSFGHSSYLLIFA